MKYLFTAFLTLIIFGAKAQTSLIAYTDEPGTVVFDKVTKKGPLNIKVGDTVVLYKFNVNSKVWNIKYKGMPATIKDTVVYQSDRVTQFKNVFINKEYLKDLKRKYGPIYASYIYSGSPAIGMTKKMFEEFKAKPDEINRTVGSWGVHEQWVYNETASGKSEYYYFENGKLTSWQD
ncbi:hypothetical protein FFF34_012370 [Inquilinus sp. KBS0705]|nr:hypothetical protein FFF34_012370 [Inquilinus sp. KBS0705]